MRSHQGKEREGVSTNIHLYLVSLSLLLSDPSKPLQRFLRLNRRRNSSSLLVRVLLSLSKLLHCSLFFPHLIASKDQKLLLSPSDREARPILTPFVLFTLIPRPACRNVIGGAPSSLCDNCECVKEEVRQDDSLSFSHFFGDNLTLSSILYLLRLPLRNCTLYNPSSSKTDHLVIPYG